ncbi:Uncharacterised protein [Rothia kristinae]|nr:Uncharacterised protein [Rothia kristinae]
MAAAFKDAAGIGELGVQARPGRTADSSWTG